ncbi:RusA family crossover junction endodeoxyribonuclease [Laribacter hongkongensis]|uniref:RusA family crossover junction endodeoxyribonuclease n=1 Tax=Laribacter hongkongensis TaxID=168471 RepID=UPI001EFE2897|nr:RusA family crossover junction endodeoxyribonuclease [Laribacter hongkongensis]MCG9081143.1 RusA family crossover junction endodeoxyribonuclease [Laribacter hongkongensis]
MTIVRFEVPGTPVGKGRPKVSTRGGKFARMYTPEKTASYEALIALSARQAMGGRPLIDGPVDVSLMIRLAVPASWSKKKQAAALAGQVLPTKKPDADNVLKAVFDGMNGVVWVDDVQACGVVLRKRFAETPGVTVVVRQMGGDHD